MTFKEFLSLSEQHKISPLFTQYKEIKKKYLDLLVFFRMGDFYELFFEDALLGSNILNIALTHKGEINDQIIPMAGIPHHQRDVYFQKIIDAGYKAVICEQKEKEDQQKLIERYVSQIIGPGLPYKIEYQETQYIATLGQNYLCLLSVTEYHLETLFFKDEETLLSTIELLPIKEILLTQRKSFKKKDCLLSEIPKNYSDPHFLKPYLEEYIPFYEKDSFLKGELLSSIGLLCFYLKNHGIESSKKNLSLSFDQNNFVKIFESTFYDLEILPKKELEFSLLGLLSETFTQSGLRLLKKILLRPLRDEILIQERLNEVEKYIKNKNILEEVQNTLKDIKDLERIMVKVAQKKSSPQDLLFLSHGLLKIDSLIKILKKNLSFKLEDLCLKTLKTFIHNNESYIQEGFSQKRDDLYRKSFEQEKLLTELEIKLQEKSQAKNLRIKHNQILGYFIELSKKDKTLSEEFVKIQELNSVVRYSHQDLLFLEKELKKAQLELKEEEKVIFYSFCEDFLKVGDHIKELISFLSFEDIYQSLATVALKYNFTRPSFKKEKSYFFKGLFHPLVKKHQQTYTHHSFESSSLLYLITGPNMGGKTTFMREIALTQYLAQIGSFVPALEAHLPLVDGIYSRLGSDDDIQKGQSTFMVEMNQMSIILRHATSESLLLIDEIGRGTSTAEGLSLAKSLIEHLLTETKSITLFSTHFHELIYFIESFSKASNFSLKIEKKDEKMIFTHELQTKGSEENYAFDIALLAGIHPSIIERAKKLQEKTPRNISQEILHLDLSLLSPKEVYQKIETLQETYH